ncbi:hypothetical protein TNIN_157311 [Trichonephila inaurata madagascariensis]|uniref:Uncharacterized protein n=1 Tax=Trichonephila inaurata madagascariensis TaxID=2747483 RepID=A0A8X6YTV5_9ARAC|nr:hypothetical protein TNIN_157311 [Trichonephila inaurata madagascariensis]
MIRSLSDEFQSTVQAIYRWSDKDFVPNKIEAKLLLEENRLGVVKKDLEDVSTFAFSDEVKRKIKKQKSKFKSKNLDVNSNSSVKSSNQVVKSSNVVKDGDIFSAVGDRADHPEADSERDTRSGGAGSESQTGETHTLITCASIPWTHKPVERGRIFLERIFILLRVAM